MTRASPPGHFRRSGARRRVENGAAQLESRGAAERRFAARHLVQQHAQRPDIAALIGLLAAQHLGRHHRQRAGDGPVGSNRVARLRHVLDGVSRDNARARPKSSTFARPSSRDQHVRAFQIAMRHAAVMRVRERIGNLRRRSGRRSSAWQAARRMMCESGCPSTSSMTMKGWLSWVPTSWMVQILGWFRRDACCASRFRRACASRRWRCRTLSRPRAPARGLWRRRPRPSRRSPGDGRSHSGR